MTGKLDRAYLGWWFYEVFCKLDTILGWEYDIYVFSLLYQIVSSELLQSFMN